MLLFMSIKELQLHLSTRVKAQRIEQNFTQKELASRANIPLSTYRRFEQKGEGSIKDLIKILVALNRVDELENFLKPSAFSPVKYYEENKNKKEKKRVKHGRKS